jgi:hypothetical protein
VECARSVCWRYRNGRGPLFHAQGRHFVSSMSRRCERAGLFPSTVRMPKVSCATRPGTIASALHNPMPLIRQQILLTTRARRSTLSRIKETPISPTQCCCCKHASTAFVLFVRDSLFATIFAVPRHTHDRKRRGKNTIHGCPPHTHIAHTRATSFMYTIRSFIITQEAYCSRVSVSLL